MASSAGPEGASSPRPKSREPTASTVSLAYSEDFETASESRAHSEESPDRTLDTRSEFSASLQPDLSLPTLEPWRKQVRGVTRVIVKETAVQTLDPAFTYQWAEGKPVGPPMEVQALGVRAVGILGSTTKSCKVWRFGS